MELRLPQSKLARLKSTLAEWCNKKSASKHDLQVVIGLLCDAAQVVPAGRPFIRSLIDAMSRLKAANHLTRLDQRCKADLAWWHTYIEAWNGTGLFPRLPDGPSITTDASGSWGTGAFISLDHAWFQIQWPDSWSATNIAAKELLPIVVALAIWGHRCAVTRVTLYSDNYAVVQLDLLKISISPIYSAAFSSSSLTTTYPTEFSMLRAKIITPQMRCPVMNSGFIHTYFPRLPSRLAMSPPCFCCSCWMTRSLGHRIAGGTRSEPVRKRHS